MKRVILITLVALGSNNVFATCKGNIIPTTPTSRFINNGDGTVTDTQTGLMWKRCHEGTNFNDGGTPIDMGDDICNAAGGATFRWKEALQQAETLNSSGGYAGYTNWRLPNVKELASILERACYRKGFNDLINPINQEVFPSSDVTSWYWSSTQYAYGTTNTSAVGVNFSGGYEEGGYKTDQKYVRFVRDIK